MAGKKIDFDLRIAELDAETRGREPTEEEAARRAHYVERQKRQVSQAKYVAKHKDKVEKATAKWQKENIEKVRQTRRDYHNRNRTRRLRETRERTARTGYHYTYNRTRPIAGHIQDGNRSICGLTVGGKRRVRFAEPGEEVTCRRCLQLIGEI